jgi:3-ketosteroid 9alpha-monooxygenase subunit B
MSAADPPAPAARQRPSLRAHVTRIHDPCADTRSLFLTASGSLPSFLPGMFISIAIPLPGDARVRPYTIASSPEDGEPFEICFNRIPNGPGAAWLFGRVVGDELNFTGPFGAFTLDRAPAAETILIAEGTAIAPIRPILRRALAAPSGHPVTLLYAADGPDHLLYRGEFEALAAAHPRFHFEPLIVSDHAAPTIYEGLLDETNRRWVTSDADRSRHFYICGVGKGVLAMRELLRTAGYERRAVHYEQW